MLRISLDVERAAATELGVPFDIEACLLRAAGAVHKGVLMAMRFPFCMSMAAPRVLVSVRPESVRVLLRVPVCRNEPSDELPERT